MRLVRIAAALAAMTAWLAVAGPAQAVLPQQLGTVDLLSQANVQLDGFTSDNAGWSVAGAGDVNGDGIDDVIVGAPNASNNGRDLSGSAYVVFGKPSQTRVDLAGFDQQSSNTDGFRIDGVSNEDQAGLSVAGAGDVNGDGLADVVVGAPYASGTSSAYVIFGKSSSANVDLANIGQTGNKDGFRMDGDGGGDLAGFSVSGAGDVNGDGLADVIVGAPYTSNTGSAYVIFGKSSSANVGLANIGQTGNEDGFRMDGESYGTKVGVSVSGAGDVNGDGHADVLVGAPGASNNGRTDSGSAYVVYGKTLPATVQLGTLNAQEGYRIDGANGSPRNFLPGDEAGSAVAGAGDVNGDGRADLVVGAPDYGFGSKIYNTGPGAAYVVFGQSSPTNVDLKGIGATYPGFRIDGGAYSDNAGTAVADAGDLNGDGLQDVIVGAPYTDNNSRTDSGSAYVVYGKSSSSAVGLAGLGQAGNAEGFSFAGAVAGDSAGSSVAGAGDFNGDGRPDVIVGAPFTNTDGTDSYTGSAYITFGFGAPRVAYSPNSVTATVGAPIIALVPSVKRTGDPGFAVTPQLPAGLALNPSSGEITGTPAAAQPPTGYTVTMSDLAGSATASLTIQVNAPPGPPSPTPGPGPVAKGLASIKILSRSATLTRNGVARVLVACSADKGDRCRGTLTLRTAKPVRAAGQRKRVAVLGTRSFTVPAGNRATLKIRLSRANRRLVGRLGRVRVRAGATARGLEGIATRSTQTIRLSVSKSQNR